MRKFLLLLLLIATVTSCIPNKDLVYLQGKPVKSSEIKRINNEPYRLRVNDIILVNIKSSTPELVSLFSVTENNTNANAAGGGQGVGFFTGYNIDTKGNIRLPYLGEINVLGYTTKEVRQKLESLLQNYFNSSDDFFVDVKLDGIRYTIMGEVSSPGQKQVYTTQLSIFDAVTNAGDILITGNRKDVEVFRFKPSGEIEKFNLDLTDVSTLNSRSFYIQPNDFINIKPLKQKSWGTGTTGLGSFTTIASLISIVISTILISRGL